MSDKAQLQARIELLEAENERLRSDLQEEVAANRQAIQWTKDRPWPGRTGSKAAASQADKVHAYMIERIKCWMEDGRGFDDALNQANLDAGDEFDKHHSESGGYYSKERLRRVAGQWRKDKIYRSSGQSMD